MDTLLYIKANPKTDTESITFRVSESFIDTYREHNPEDTIVTLDLYREGIKPLDEDDLKAIFNPEIKRQRDHHIIKYAHQFAEADKYVFAAPMWNFSIPSILKAYIDYIALAGITFKYTSDGPVGLCQDKKAIHITARGGIYSDSPFDQKEMGDRYLRNILGFMGIKDIDTLAIQGLNIVSMDREAIIDKAIKEARKKAEIF